MAPPTNKKRSAKLSLSNTELPDLKGEPTEVVFAGSKGSDIVMFDNNWYDYEVFEGNIHIFASGLNPKRDYTCKLSSANGRGSLSTNAKLVGTDTLDCGPIPKNFPSNNDYILVRVKGAFSARL